MSLAVLSFMFNFAKTELQQVICWMFSEIRRTDFAPEQIFLAVYGVCAKSCQKI